MQVSWIDADLIKALVAQIEPLETCAEKVPGVMDIDTTPEALMGSLPETGGFVMDRLEPIIRPAPAFPAPAAVVAEPVAAKKPLLPAVLEAEVEDETDEGVLEPVPAPPLANAAAALPLSRIRDKLRAIRQRASEAGILTRAPEVVPIKPALKSPAPVFGPVHEIEFIEEDGAVEHVNETEEESVIAAPRMPSFEIPQGTRDVRLAAFAGWARQVVCEDGGHVLVMSDDGEVLWGGEAKAGLVLSTMMAWGAAIRASAMSACATPPLIHQSLASGNVLTVIPCETADGMVHAAVAAPAGLSHEQARVLRGALCAAMN